MSRPEAHPSTGADLQRPLRVAALIPALNEEDALPGVLSELRRARLDRIVVIDNGSTDATASVAKEGGAEVVREPRRGYGAACLAGIGHLAKDPPDIVVFLDGDQSDDPSAIERILAPIRRGRADFVVGIRAGSEANGESAVPPHARLGNALVLGLARLLHGARFRDLGPFRAVRYSTLQALEMDDRNWGWTLQMQLRAHHQGVRTEEVDVSHRARAAGRSKVSGSLRGSVSAGLKMLFTLVRERLLARARKGSAGTTAPARGN